MLTKTTLEELDKAGVTEPTGFERQTAIKKVRTVVPSLVAAIGTGLQIVDDLEDGSSFAELSLREEVPLGQVARAKIAFTFSQFGELCLIWSDELDPDQILPRYGECVRLLRIAGFQPVLSAELSSDYDGVHDVWRGHSWEDRFFGYP